MSGFNGHVHVLIADDHALVRQALCQLIGDQPLQVGGRKSIPRFVQVADYDAAVEALAAETAQLLLIDLTMPGMAGSASLRSLRGSYPDTKIVVITGREDRATMLDCLAAGVHGYILKTSAPEAIVRAIEAILSGQIYMPPEIADVIGIGVTVETDAAKPVLQHSATTSAPNTARFTKRQLDVLLQLGQGCSTKEIARSLGLGQGTVKVHLAAIYRHLRARNRTEAVLLASRHLN